MAQKSSASDTQILACCRKNIADHYPEGSGYERDFICCDNGTKVCFIIHRNICFLFLKVSLDDEDEFSSLLPEIKKKKLYD